MKTKTLAWLNPNEWKVYFENRRIRKFLSKLLGIDCKNWIVIGADEKTIAWRSTGITVNQIEMLDYIKRVLLTQKQRN